jgi:predicted nucleic acid-binding protein
MAEPPLRLLDTSVIMRYLVGDDPSSQERASALIESDTPVGITTTAVLEASFALRRLYGYSRESVVDVLVELISRENAVGVGVDLRRVAARLALCRPSGTVSFGDALLAATGATYGVDEAYTFDQKLDRSGLTTIVL